MTILENSFWIYKGNCLCKENIENSRNKCTIKKFVTVNYKIYSM